MRRFFDDIELTPEEEEAMTEAAEATPLDDPELEAAVQEARKRLAADETNAEQQQKKQKQRSPKTPHLPAGGQ
jgi:hypothetical protein